MNQPTPGGGVVVIPNALSTSLPNPELTVEAWVNYTSGSTRTIIEEDSAALVMRIQSGFLTVAYAVFGVGSVSVADPTPFPLGRWVHVATTYDGRHVRIYRDGIKVAELLDVRRPPNIERWVLGRTSGSPLLGQIDDLAFYGRALTDAEILAHAQERDDAGTSCDLCPSDPNPSCVPTTCTDADGDGFGIQGATACSGGVDKIDCNDANPAIRPGATEVTDAVDNDCDGVTDGKMVTPTVTTQTYDANGNQVRKAAADGLTEYVFDARDRLVNINIAGATVATYGYDTENLRVYGNVVGDERKVLLDGIEELAEYDDAGTRVSRYDHDPTRVDALLAQLTASKTHTATDALTSVYGLADATGAVQARYSYDVFGAKALAKDSVTTNWGFTGRRDDRTGQMYYRARYYEPSTGTFLSRDPAWRSAVMSASNFAPSTAANVKQYTYVDSRPTTLSDPTGLWPTLSKSCGVDVETALGQAVGYLRNAAAKAGPLQNTCSCLMTDKWDQFHLNLVRIYMTGVLSKSVCRDIKVLRKVKLPNGSTMEMQDCGYAPPDEHDTIEVAPACGCVGGIILHETAHHALSERGHPPQIGNRQKCFCDGKRI